MKETEVFPISSNFTISVDEGRAYSPPAEVEERVNRVWDSENKILKNEQILNVAAIKSNEIVGYFIPYKYVFAMKQDPTLKGSLSVCTVGVSGITMCDGHILIGKRSSHVAYYPDFYELAPSGGIDNLHVSNGKIDIYNQLLDEMEEETGIPKGLVKEKELLLMIHDFKVPSIDICIRLDLDPAALNAIDSFSRDEYSEMQWVPEEKVPQIIKKGEWVPLSQELGIFIRPI